MAISSGRPRWTVRHGTPARANFAEQALDPQLLGTWMLFPSQRRSVTWDVTARGVVFQVGSHQECPTLGRPVLFLDSQSNHLSRNCFAFSCHPAKEKDLLCRNDAAVAVARGSEYLDLDAQHGKLPLGT